VGAVEQGERIPKAWVLDNAGEFYIPHPELPLMFPASPGNGGEAWPLVCEHCGNPEHPGKPVEAFEVEGQRYLLHPPCHADWLDGPDPDGWSFNLDNDDAPQKADEDLRIPDFPRRA
jgi:hypothetical protein